MNMRSKNILQLLEESKYTVAISGKEMFLENGYPGVRDGEESYEIEQKYGYSAEEILSSAFYATRKACSCSDCAWKGLFKSAKDGGIRPCTLRDYKKAVWTS